MKLKQLLAALFVLLFAAAASAQNKNPYESIGKQGKILTLTKGGYDELFDKDSIQQVGTVLINIHTMKIVKLLNDVQPKQQSDGDKHSRFLSLDPLAGKYPFESPYSFAANTPIIAIDKDGKFPLWTHYQMIYEDLLAAKVDKKSAAEIALFGSTYADHPTDWFVMPYNRALAANYLYSPLRLSYDNPDYEETENSQSDELISSVSIHGMRTWWEDITPEQAVNRALYGGTFKELNGTVIKIKGAYEVINELKGKDISKLSRQEKKALGMALHTIEDAKVHKGARWVYDNKDKAKKIGHKNEHPTSHEIPVNKKEHDEADAATQAAINSIQPAATTTETEKKEP